MEKVLRLGRGQRLRTPKEFERVFRQGRRLDGRMFTLIATRNASTRFRLGVAVSRKLGKATSRNRVRRVLRESFRRLVPRGEPGFDLVIVAKKDLLGRRQGEVDREFAERLGRLTAVGGRRRAPAAAAD